MKLQNLDKVILGIDKQPLTNKSGEPLTVKYVLADIISSGFDGMKNLDNVRSFQLATRLMDATKELEVSIDGIDLIKKSIDQNKKGYIPIVLGLVLLESGLESGESTPENK